MSSPVVPTRLLGAVRAGDRLPDLHHDVTTSTVVLGATACRDWTPVHHDHRAATEQAGMRDIFLSTPTQAAWFERYLGDWIGPHGRLGRMTFRMRDSVYPGDAMVLRGVVREVTVDDAGCGWVALEVELTVGDRVCSTCEARVALPVDADDNPWRRRGDAWRP